MCGFYKTTPLHITVLLTHVYLPHGLPHVSLCSKKTVITQNLKFFHHHGKSLVVPTRFPRNPQLFLSVSILSTPIFIYSYLFLSIFVIVPTQNISLGVCPHAHFFLVCVPTQNLDINTHPHAKVPPFVGQ